MLLLFCVFPGRNGSSPNGSLYSISYLSNQFFKYTRFAIYIKWVSAVRKIGNALQMSFKELFFPLFLQLSHELEQRWSGCEARIWVWRIFPRREEGGAATPSKFSHIICPARIRWEKPATPIILQDRIQKSKFWWGKCVSMKPSEISLWRWIVITSDVIFPQVLWRWRRGVEQQCGLAVHPCWELSHSAADAGWWWFRQWRWPTGCFHDRGRGENRVSEIKCFRSICCFPELLSFSPRTKQPKTWENWRRRRKSQPSKTSIFSF